MAQARKNKVFRRLAAWVNLIWLLALPFFLHALIYIDRHPLEVPLLWKMKSGFEVVVTGMLPVEIGVIRPYYVGVSIIVVTVIYLLKLIATLAFSSLRSFSRVGVLALGIVVLLTPVTLGRAGMCAYELRHASADDMLGRAIAKGIKNGDLDPAIATVADYYQSHNRKTCCHVAPRKKGLPSISDVFEEISAGRIFDVVYDGDAKQHRTSVEMCNRSSVPR